MAFISEKNGRLFEEIQVPDQGQMSENLTAIKSFSERYPDIPVSMILAPDAACVLSESLPLFGGVEGSESADQYGEKRAG